MSDLLFQRQEPPLTKGAERERFYDRRSHPARLTMEETAWALGFSAHEIPVLIAKGLLQPLGHPAPNTMKWFAAETVEGLRHDVKWLTRSTDAMMEHWRQKNARKT
ncbi:MAG: hypothetical protein KGS61_18680, partial [Verrucomicrobia bacterium]|nr:hypothetical protein [Verrucomicrobiota bacterium]